MVFLYKISTLFYYVIVSTYSNIDLLPGEAQKIFTIQLYTRSQRNIEGVHLHYLLNFNKLKQGLLYFV